MYMVGYEDDGKATGISPSDLSASIKTLKVMMKAVGAKISKMEVRRLGGSCGGGARESAMMLTLLLLLCTRLLVGMALIRERFTLVP